MKRKMRILLSVIGCLIVIAVSGNLSCKQGSSNEASQVIDVPFKVAKADILISSDHTDKIDLVVSYPVNAEEDFPLIVFSHGNGLKANAYHNLTDKWVEMGYVVVAPNHLDGGSQEIAGAAQKTYGSDWVSASRVLDLSESIKQINTVVKQLPDFKGQVDTKEIIAAGHSFGALTAQMLAGATLEKQGNSKQEIPTNLKDDRVVAVVAISPPGLIPNFLSEKTWAAFDTPQLVVTGTNDISPPFWPKYEVHLVSYEAAVAGNNNLLVLEDSDHYLGNLIGNLALEEAPQKLALQNMIDQTSAFINHHLKPSLLNNLEALESVQARKGIVRYERR